MEATEPGPDKAHALRAATSSVLVGGVACDNTARGALYCRLVHSQNVLVFPHPSYVLPSSNGALYAASLFSVSVNVQNDLCNVPAIRLSR